MDNAVFDAESLCRVIRRAALPDLIRDEIERRITAYPYLLAEIERLQTALNERDQARACTRWLVAKYEEQAS